MMTENDSNPAPSDAPVTTLPLRRFAMPALTLDMATLRYNENKVLTAELMRPDADIHVDIQDGFLFCRGEREALIRSGILKASGSRASPATAATPMPCWWMIDRPPAPRRRYGSTSASGVTLP